MPLKFLGFSFIMLKYEKEWGRLCGQIAQGVVPFVPLCETKDF